MKVGSPITVGGGVAASLHRGGRPSPGGAWTVCGTRPLDGGLAGPSQIASEGPDDPEWGGAIAALLASRARRVVVLGPVDSGKSTFCRRLLAASGHQGGAMLIDADIGQKMVGPPATVTLASAMAPDTVSALAFVGTTDPIAGGPRLIAGLNQLRHQAGSGLLVVNTSGCLHPGCRRLKSAKLAVVEPDAVVALGEDPDCEAVLSDHPALPLLRLRSVPGVCRKSPGRRRACRKEAFRRYLECAALHDLALPQHGPALCEQLLVGLTAPDGQDLALGVVEELDPAGGWVRVRSPAPPGQASGLVAGQMRLDPSFDARPL